MGITVNVTWKKSSKDIKIKAETLGGALKELEKRDEWGQHEGGISPTVKVKDGNVTELTLAGTSEIQMPQWSGYNGAPKACKKEWDRMYKALDKHEEEHRTLYVDVVEKFAEGLRKKTDPLTVEQVKALIKALDKKLDDDSEKYDTKTGHGSKDGVNLDIAAECE
jgi:predicted secreted Zn-dependent protease